VEASLAHGYDVTLFNHGQTRPELIAEQHRRRPILRASGPIASDAKMVRGVRRSAAYRKLDGQRTVAKLGRQCDRIAAAVG